LVKCPAKKEDEKTYSIFSNIGINFKDGNVLEKYVSLSLKKTKKKEDFSLLWGVASAVFEIKTDKGIVVPIVKRTFETQHPNEWALLPAGGIDTTLELRHPNIAMNREIIEELILFENGEYVNPLDSFNFVLEKSKVIINDEANGKKYYAYGEFFEHEKKLFLIGTYRSKKVFKLEDLIVFDGEKKGIKYLNRKVALIPVNSNLYGEKTPVVARYQGCKHCKQFDKYYIDLSASETSTLEYLRKKWKKKL
jgi:hypothetical protein